jgi:hypothetical protein
MYMFWKRMFAKILYLLLCREEKVLSDFEIIICQPNIGVNT